MKRTRTLYRVARWGSFIALLPLFQSIGCLPNNAFGNVFANNITFTSAIVIQSLTSLFFKNFFPQFF